jgi:hypothetical protein
LILFDLRRFIHASVFFIDTSFDTRYHN